LVPREIIFSTEYQRRTLAQDAEIIHRILDSYRATLESVPIETQKSIYGQMWTGKGFKSYSSSSPWSIFRRKVLGVETASEFRQLELIRALDERSAEKVHEILSRLFITEAAHGIAMGKSVGEITKQSLDEWGLFWANRLQALAYAVGARPVLSPEHGLPDPPPSSQAQMEELTTDIEHEIGIDLKFPDICGVFGGESHGSAFPHIAFSHLCAAASLRDLAISQEPIIAEIGGGFGGLAYWTNRLIPCKYTIYDLPFTSAMQAYFLSRALPEKKLKLFGERGDAEISLHPAWLLLSRDGVEPMDILVNQDSFPEIDIDTAVNYLKTLHRLCRQIFLSINHETPARDPQTSGRTSVAQLTRIAGGWKRIQRSRYFLRDGYVQELYRPITITQAD
jgi:hypothetical protein